MSSDITVILTLFNTPEKSIRRLVQYKKYKLIIFNQASNLNDKKRLKKILKIDYKYFFSSKNLGLSKSSNFLLSKVKTKYCLFTQPDIIISNSAITNLKRLIQKEKKAIFIAPKYSKKKKTKNSKKKIKYEIVKKIDAACLLCNVNKLKKIGFFDEDFFLYWEDIYLMKKIKNTDYKMLEAKNVYAKHEGGKSSGNSIKVSYIRSLNFIFGELLYDFKVKKMRFIKILRKLLQNLILFFFNIIKFELKEVNINLARIHGIMKFILFYLKNFLIIKKSL